MTSHIHFVTMFTLMFWGSFDFVSFGNTLIHNFFKPNFCKSFSFCGVLKIITNRTEYLVMIHATLKDVLLKLELGILFSFHDSINLQNLYLKQDKHKSSLCLWNSSPFFWNKPKSWEFIVSVRGMQGSLAHTADYAATLCKKTQ